MKMNKKIKDKWLKALRSGEYKQGICRLRNNDTFCCLGVLTDLYIKKHGLKWQEINEAYFFEETSTLLPIKVYQWAGLSKPNPTVNIHNSSYSLSNCNDNLCLKFNEIANLIEESL